MDTTRNIITSYRALGRKLVDSKRVVGTGLDYETISELLADTDILLNGQLVDDTNYSVTWQIYYDGSWKKRLYDGTFYVKAVSTSPITTLSGNKTIDGYTTSEDDVVLLANEGTPHMNGIWVVKSGTWERHAIFDTGLDDISGVIFKATNGTNYKNSLWVFTTLGDLTISDNPADFATATWLDFELLTPSKNYETQELSSNNAITRFKKKTFVDATTGDITINISSSVLKNVDYYVRKDDDSTNKVLIYGLSGVYPVQILTEWNDWANIAVLGDGLTIDGHSVSSNRKTVHGFVDGRTSDGLLPVTVPAGYTLYSVYGILTGSTSTKTFDIGTTSGANDVLDDETFTDSGDEAVVDTVLSTSLEKQLFISCSDWTDVEIDLTITMVKE